MMGFFETIVSRRGIGELWAAWILDGENAGSRALFDRQGERYPQIFREDTFPDAFSTEIELFLQTKLHTQRDLPADMDGIPQLPGNPGPEKKAQDGILELSCEEDGRKRNVRVFLEKMTQVRKLVICGAGHVSLALIRLAVMLDLEVTVIEDRKEYARRARETGARYVICKPFTEALDEIGGNPMTAFVIMTREHVHDVDCLRQILHKPYIYAGMMGSRSRSGQIRQQLLSEGYAADKVEQLHMPIGLAIGSRTPAQIAVSIMAELIQVLNASDTGEGFPPGMPEELTALEHNADEQKPAAVLAMIVKKEGEAPRRPGTRMLVRKDGSFLGTIGGGYAEARILETAKEMLLERCNTPRLLRISMKKGMMYCGGEISVFLLPL